MKPINKTDILRKIIERSEFGTSRQETLAIMTSFIDIIVEEVSKGNDVHIRDLGAWVWATAPAITRWNRFKAEFVDYPERKVLRYKFNMIWKRSKPDKFKQE